MNFIGHAHVALWTSSSPAFVLGAMLPDFASMAGTRLAPIEQPELAAGVSLHHHTDEVFHGSAPFIALMQEAMDALTSLGVARGPARAVAHIGVELLIDGELVRGIEIGSAYLSALEVCATLPAATFLGSRAEPLASADGHERSFRHLSRRLIEHGIPYDYERPEQVTARLGRILAGRPRLALSAEALLAVGSTMPDVKARVQERLPELIEVVRDGLSHTRCSSRTTR